MQDGTAENKEGIEHLHRSEPPTGQGNLSPYHQTTFNFWNSRWQQSQILRNTQSEYNDDSDALPP